MVGKEDKDVEGQVENDVVDEGDDDGAKVGRREGADEGRRIVGLLVFFAVGWADLIACGTAVGVSEGDTVTFREDRTKRYPSLLVKMTSPDSEITGLDPTTAFVAKLHNKLPTLLKQMIFCPIPITTVELLLSAGLEIIIF